MTRFFSLVILSAFFVTPVLAAEPADDAAKVKASLEKWQQVKKECKGSYSYTVRWSSFAGFGHSTEIVVRDNKVAERKFKSFNRRLQAPNPPGKPAPKADGNSWTEKGKELGTHKKGAALKTLDELYVEAAKVAKLELPQHLRRYVRVDKQGLLLSCFTVDTRIADDAPTNGVQVSSIKIATAKGSEEDGKVYSSPNGTAFPKHWGAPPRAQTRDLRTLPGDYGRGSGTLLRWIRENMDRDAKKKQK